jgi:hypothetical protein
MRDEQKRKKDAGNEEKIDGNKMIRQIKAHYDMDFFIGISILSL